MAKYDTPSGDTPLDLTLRELAEVKNRVQALEGRRLSTWDRGDHTTIAAPVEGQHIVDLDDSVWYYSNGTWRNLAGPPIYCIKVFADWQNVRTGDGRFMFAIDEDVDGKRLTDLDMYVTTASSSGIVQCQVRNITNGNVDMLSTKIQVDANELHSATAATAFVINTANDDVSYQQIIAIDVDAAGTNARGLGISLTFAS